MKTRTINFARDFTDCPGGRYEKYGEYSGEQFRDHVLRPALEQNDLVILEMDGVLGFPASFLDEAFGILVEQIGHEALKNKLRIELTDNRVALSEIRDCIAKHVEAASPGAVAA
jgi:STAS-like domain of unknown function (DUF4325)